MHTVNIKPLSANGAFKGRRFKTKEYIKYQKDLSLILPKINLPDPPFVLYLEFGFSNSLSDWDNGIKQFQDCLSEKYNFNDRHIYKGVVEKKIVKRGQEYIKFRIEHYEENNPLS